MKTKPHRVPSVLLASVALALLGSCGAATRPPAEVLPGHWQSDKQRELYVGDGRLVWVLPSSEVGFDFETTREDRDAREIDVKIATPGGVKYSVRFEPDYESGTLTELTSSRTVHQLTRLDDQTTP